MAYGVLPGFGALWPSIVSTHAWTSSTSWSVSSATGKNAHCGRVYWSDGSATKDITKVWFKANSVTIPAGAQFRVSLQDLSLTSGPPLQPDGTIDQSFTYAAGVGPTANAWNSVTLDAARTVSLGAFLGVVFDWATFVSTASVAGFCNSTGNSFIPSYWGVSTFNGTTWSTASATAPHVVFEFSDGTYGTPFGMPNLNDSLNFYNFNSTSSGSGGVNAGNERGVQFEVSVPMYVSGMTFDGLINSGAGADVVLYADTTALITVSGDNNQFQAPGNYTKNLVLFPEAILLVPGTTYRLTLKALTSTNIQLYAGLYGASTPTGFFDLIGFGSTMRGIGRTSGGSWGTPSRTIMPFFNLIISSINDGSGGGGMMLMMRRNQSD